jgi:two-component system cell cycle sensor histidine kinase/response regulator CckA
MRFFQNTPMAIATVDKQGTIVRSNALFARLFNPVLKGEVSGGRSILAVVAERDRSALEAAIRRAADKQGEIAPVDAALEGAGEHFARFYVTAVEEVGDQEAAIIYALDTTEQRALQNQLNQQQKMELVGQLAGGIAHDFNNVLGAIMMASDFLVNAHKPTDPSFQDIIQIRQNANRAAAMVRHLLAFSRKQTLRPQVIDLGDVVFDLTMLLRRLIGERIALNVVPQRDLWPVKADLAQFEQVLVNLVVNARDAMAEGGKLTLRTTNVGADQSAKYQYKGMPVGEYVLIEVEDTGTGIPPEIIDKIFDPFFTTKDVGKGTGLGLSTVYGIVKQTGGFIYVESQQGQDSQNHGTTFRIFIPRYIPAADDVQPPQLPETTAPALAGALSAAEDAMKTAADLTGHGVILLVEDEEGLRALNARGLASRGYTVVEAGNGVEAMEMMERQGGKIDLVVSDVVMPEMDGPTLLKELRKKNPHTKFIFVSGYAEDAFQKSLPDPDDYNFLAKPFTLKQLVAKVKETMATV